jgi:hypothetical protein
MEPQFLAALPEGLRRLYYIVGQDQHEVRAEVRGQTEDRLSRTAEALASSRALLDRLHREEEARKLCRPQVHGKHSLPNEVYLFLSPTRKVFCFTSHPDGANLPREFAPWEEVGGISNDVWLATEVTDAIRRNGFYLLPRP